MLAEGAACQDGGDCFTFLGSGRGAALKVEDLLIRKLVQRREINNMKPKIWILPAVPMLLLGLIVHMRGLVPPASQAAVTSWDAYEFSAMPADGELPEGYCPAEDGRVEEIRVIFPSEWGVPYPAGLSYSLARDQIALLDESESSGPKRDGSTIVVITPYEDLVGSAHLAFLVENPINMAYDDGGQLLLLDDNRAELSRVPVGEHGVPVRDTLTRFDIGHLDLARANGMAIDAEGGRLLILDSGALQIVSADIEDEFELITKIDLAHLGDLELSGIAIHPVSQNLFVVSPAEKIMYELAQSGALVNRYDLTVLDLVEVRGMGFGPSADLTDDADTVHLFMADSNKPHVESATKERVYGRILEIAIYPGCGGRCQVN